MILKKCHNPTNKSRSNTLKQTEQNLSIKFCKSYMNKAFEKKIKAKYCGGCAPQNEQDF